MNIKQAIIVTLAGAFTVLALSASSCDSQTANTSQNAAADDAGNAARGKWGDPKVKNYTEYQMALEIVALRDQQNLVMFAYLQGNDGSLRCFGKVVGYGLPYSTQIWPPDQPITNAGNNPIREPNALFMPESAEATWIRLIGPDGKTKIAYVEPRLVVLPFELPCKKLNE